MKKRSNALKLVYVAVIVGILIGVLEIYIGHRLILDPILQGREYNFVYESYFAPTYYGFAKSIITGAVFFFVYLFMPKNKFKSGLVGIVGTFLFGVYYYFTFPKVSVAASILIAAVHFVFIAGISYAGEKVLKV